MPQFNDHIATHTTGFYHKLSTLHYPCQIPLQSSLSDARQRESYDIKNTEANCNSSNRRKSNVVPVHVTKAYRIKE
jgi:hypothetical protein